MKFIAINVYIEKQEKSQINNLTLYFQELEKEEESPKLVKQITKVIAEINKRDQKEKKKKTKEMINEIKRWFFEKIINIETPFTRLIKRE